MKAKFFLFFLIFFISCSVSKVDFNSLKKEYAGTVEFTISNNDYMIINTDINSIPIKSNFKIKKGTKCYFYYVKDKDGHNVTMFIFEGANKGYKVY
jgi:hypothetical protein